MTRREFLVHAGGYTATVGALMVQAETPELWKLGIVDASELVRRKTVSPVELTQAFLTRIEKLNPLVNAFITVTAEQALQQARVSSIPRALEPPLQPRCSRIASPPRTPRWFGD
jgi:hypothetical protein